MIERYSTLRCSTGGWLVLDLEGTVSNRDAAGARVEVLLSDGSRQYSHVSTAGSYLSASDRRIHFGLGDRQVTWVESNGTRQFVENVAPRRIFRGRETGRGPAPQ